LSKAEVWSEGKKVPEKKKKEKKQKKNLGS